MNASTPSSDRDESPTVDARRQPHYRCVCGNTFSVDPATGGACPRCQRRATAEAIGTAAAETLSIGRVDPHTIVAVAADAPPPPYPAGHRLGHFELEHCLGQGGMGAVYRAVDHSLERYVALKVIRTPQTGHNDTQHVEQLVQEARAQARAVHPNIVQVYFVGQQDHAPYFAMELVPGPTVANRLAAGPLPFATVVRLALQIVDALRQAAELDIVHGDIKPSNILLAAGDVAKLSDFGLARRLSQQRGGDRGITGTPNYLPPEAGKGRPLDIRSDMYSLGVTLFEMTFGRLPYGFTGSSLEERLDAHRQAPIEFPEPWPANVPVGWRDVLSRLLAKRPEDRYADYAELAADVRRLQPMELPKAGRLQRTLAWVVDLLLVHAVHGLLTAAWHVEATAETPLQQRPLLRLFGAGLGALAPLGFAYLQTRWMTTPGKKLFQIRIVDEHGLRPGREKLLVRSVVQMAPVWLTVLAESMDAVHLGPLAALIGVGVALALGVDCLLALFDRRGRGLHDRVLGTQVVLDAATSTSAHDRSR